MFERTKDTMKVLEGNEALTITKTLALFQDMCADVKDSEGVSVGKLATGDEDDFVLGVCRTGRVLLNIIKNQKGAIETAENNADIEKLEAQLQDADDQLSDIKVKIEQAKIRKQELAKTLSLYQSEYAEYEEQLEMEQRLQSECERLKRRIEESEELDTEKLIDRKLELEEQLKQCEMVCGQLKNENEKLESNLEIAKDRLREEQAYKQNVSTELAAIIKRSQECSVTSEALEKNKAEKEKEIIILQEECESKQSQIENLRSEVIPQLQQKISDMEIKLSYQEEEYKKRKVQFDSLESDFALATAEDEKWNAVLEEKERETKLLLDEIEQSKKKAEELDNRVKSLGAEQKDLLNRIDAGQNAINARDISSLRVLCEEKEKELAEVEQKSGELKMRIEEFVRNIEEGRRELEVQNGLANSKQVECEVLKEKIDKEQERKKQLDGQYDELCNWLESMHLDNYKDEVEKRRVQVEILETARTNFKAYIWKMPTYAGYILEDEKCEKANLYFGEELTRISNALKEYLHNYNELMNLYNKNVR